MANNVNTRANISAGTSRDEQGPFAGPVEKVLAITWEFASRIFVFRRITRRMTAKVVPWMAMRKVFDEFSLNFRGLRLARVRNLARVAAK